MNSNIFSCEGKTAVVTGAAGLLGSRIAQTLSELGADVYAADCSKPAGSLQGYGLKHLFMDITSEASVKKALNTATKASGSLDIMVNCAYPRTNDWSKKLESIPFASWKKNTNDQLGGYFLASRAAAEIMKRQKRGSIINFASIYGITAPDFRIYEGTDTTMPAAYSAIKGGVIMFTRYLATYYAKYNIRANVISPGGIEGGQSRSFIKKYVARTPLGRMGKPDDITGAAVYLASDASSYVTGINLVVDGGWTAW